MKMLSILIDGESMLSDFASGKSMKKQKSFTRARFVS